MRLNPFTQTDFLYFYSLQAGVVICSSIGIFLSITAFAVNLASENSEVETIIMVGQYIMLSIWCIVSLCGFVIGLFSAYQENGTLALISALIQFVMFLYWFTLLLLSFLNKPSYTRSICLENRCPDHIWIQDARWRLYSAFCDPADAKLPIISSSSKSEFSLITNETQEIDKQKAERFPFLKIQNKTKGKIVLYAEEEEPPESASITEKLWLPRADVGRPLLLTGSIILSILAAFFFIYSVTTLVSYRNELKELEEDEEAE